MNDEQMKQCRDKAFDQWLKDNPEIWDSFVQNNDAVFTHERFWELWQFIWQAAYELRQGDREAERPCLIPLTKNQFTVVDARDYDFLTQWQWHLSGDGYAIRSVFATKANGEPRAKIGVRMHNILLPHPEGWFVDHINSNRLDNRKGNLRICDIFQNAQNKGIQKKPKSSKYKGVCFVRRGGIWNASIKSRGVVYQIGRFRTEMEAALAYNEAAKKYHGEFAKLNFVHHETPTTAFAPMCGEGER